MIPVTVLTGFLGSGKTTMLAHMLRQPAFSRTAVLINEFGDVGLDHDLVAASEESFVELATGCLCCKVRGDLAATLIDLLARRDAGTVMAFERVVIETSGLADPAPILHALMTDRGLAERVALAGVVATLDVVHGMSTLDREPIAVKQVAVADRLVLTKTDLVPDGERLLRETVRALNPAAPIVVAQHGRIDPAYLVGSGLYARRWQDADLLSWLRADEKSDGASTRHDAQVQTYAILRDTPLPAIVLTLFLEALAEHAGSGLLRLKGLVSVREQPDRPAVIHGVQHVFYPLEWLERWPSADRRSRIVFIVRTIPRGWVDALLAAIEAEVAATLNEAGA